MTQTPTDALRLVPIDMQIESILHDLVEEVSAAQRGARVKARARQCCARGAAKNALFNLLATAPASPLQGGGWQDISTAPKDGTPLLAGSIHHSDREVVCWQDGLPSGSMDTDAEWEGWVNDGPHKDRFYANPRYFTHWMPLPAAPTGDARNGKGEG